MKILIIDSHKGTKHGIPQNMHWQNAKILADYLGADLIWSYPTVNDNIKTGYDVIIFVHASHYSFTDTEWILKNPDAKLFYITNEYNLGEPLMLWKLAKQGRKYSVIANHPDKASKVVLKYTDKWDILNLNCLIYDRKESVEKNDLFSTPRANCIYYGSFRKDRSKYFARYLDKNVMLSTHPKNVDKFLSAGAKSLTGKRIDWANDGLFPYKQSLYIEDEKTHKHYNYLANRFYESLNYDCTPMFAEECLNTLNLSGYDIPDDYIINDSAQLKEREYLTPLNKWHEMANKEKQETLIQIKNIIQ
jgi:hypothetical protein